MLTQPQSPARRTVTAILLIGLLCASATRVLAQEQSSSLFVDAIKRAALDPTTYAPAGIAYYATYQDWKTSQPFFARGANEMNPRYTVSGLSNDTPIDYGTGKQRIFRDALINLQISAVTNVTSNVVENLLIKRYPDHRKLVRGLAWAERISVASFLAYRMSSPHFQQAALNEQLARQWGYTQ